MKKILIISSFILVIISISIVGYSIVSANVVVDEEKDIISYQLNKEKYINPYGYTFDEPNIIVNPYGISPLTALILFETEEEVLAAVEKAIILFRDEGIKGERFADTIERLGFDYAEKKITD